MNQENQENQTRDYKYFSVKMIYENDENNIILLKFYYTSKKTFETFREQFKNGPVCSTLFDCKKHVNEPSVPIQITLESSLRNALYYVLQSIKLKCVEFFKSGSIGNKDCQIWHVNDVPINADAINRFYFHIMMARKILGEQKYKIIDNKIITSDNSLEFLIFSNGEKWYLLSVKLEEYIDNIPKPKFVLDLQEYTSEGNVNMQSIETEDYPSELIQILNQN